MPRSILSMTAFTNELSSSVKGLSYTFDSGERIYQYINNSADANHKKAADKLLEKLRTSFGVKASDKVMEASEKALKAAKIKTTKVKGISHCWAKDIDPKAYTGFRYHEEMKRKDDELPLPEVRNAVVCTLMDNGPLDENELLVKTARTFGYQRLGPNLRNRLSEGIAFAVSDKLIRLNKEKKYELREA